ncbi:hypothetical protein SALBM217S_03968 [Streptomyces griseoloalbus]
MTETVDVDEELLSIGAFAARSRLSAKALRLYDRLGLLAPARVDADTGYRYYRADQVERARLVALLRQLDMPLARIAEVVDAGDGAAQARRLDAYWADVEARHASRRTLAGYLRGRLSGRSLEMYGKFTVETVDVPEQVVITESRHILADELPAWIGASLGRLEEGARACGGVTGSPFVVYHSEVSVESDGPAEAACRSPTRRRPAPGPRSGAGPGGRRCGWSRRCGWPAPGSPRRRSRIRRSWPRSRRWRSGCGSGG